MNQRITERPNGARPVPLMPADTPVLPETSDPGARKSLPRRHHAAQPARAFPTALVIAACVAVHLLAAALMYRDLARDLYSLFDASPRLLVLEHGLTRLTAVAVFLPPVIPAALIVMVWLWVGKARRDADVARWLALALVPLAADGVLRAIGVLLAAPPANIGELLDLPTRFSLGPRLVLDLARIQPSATILYWAVVATLPAVASAWCVARALLVAEEAASTGVGQRRRRRMATIDALQVGVAVAGTWIALAFAGQVVLPWATQLFLKTFG
jgi:hypothetical protein